MTETRIRVRYKDTDSMGVVYYSNYFIYMEVGRIEFLREGGWGIREVEKEVFLPVIEASCRYKKPAILDDLLLIRTKPTNFKKMTFCFEYEIIREETNELLAIGMTSHACIDPGTKRLIPVPDWLKNLIGYKSS